MSEGQGNRGWPLQNVISAMAAALLASAIGWLVNTTIVLGQTMTGVQRDIDTLRRDLTREEIGVQKELADLRAEIQAIRNVLMQTQNRHPTR